MAIPNAFEDETNSWWIREGEKLAEDGRDLLYLTQGAEMERERIIKLLESKLVGKATNVETGLIDWSSFEGDVLSLIKGSENVGDGMDNRSEGENSE